MATITGSYYGQNLYGTSGNDTIDGAGGKDYIDGGSGIDTAVFFSNSSDFTVADLSGVVRVIGLSSAPADYKNYTVELLNVEKLQFLDKTVALTPAANNSTT